jgi:hypothetical protein
MTKTLIDSLHDVAREQGWDVTAETEHPPLVIEQLDMPHIFDETEHNGVLTFSIRNCDVSLVNALRRIILSEIPVCCIRTENEQVNQCHISVNDTRLHNEILKQRLSSIPIHTTDLTWLPQQYELFLDIVNDTEHTLLVTSEHFQVRKKGTVDQFLTTQQTTNLFPPDPITHDFVEFARLRPSISIERTHPRIALTADFNVATAADNAMFNVASICTYYASPDTERIRTTLSEKQIIWKANGLSATDITFHSNNFMLLDAQRIAIHNQWHVRIQTIGVLTNTHIRRTASHILAAHAHALHSFLPTLQTPHITTPFGFSIGHLLEHALHTLFRHHTTFYNSHPHKSFHLYNAPTLQHTQLAASLLLLYSKGTCGSP